MLAVVMGALWIPGAARADVTIEYVAQACFIVESESGTRVAIDPYNGNLWLGYDFPEDLTADAVLVTHPHYDHDASYYFGSVPTFTQPGTYRVGDITITGIEGKHVDPYGAEFGQLNTLWLIEVDGVHIAHLGDNGLPRRAALAAIVQINVLMIPADGDDHILKPNEIASVRDVLQPSITIPMHYRVTELSDRPASLGPIEPWLARQTGVNRLATHTFALAPGALPTEPEIWVPRPSPTVRRWSDDLRHAWEARDDARHLMQEETWPSGRVEALDHLQTAARLAPDVSVFAFDLADTLRDAGQPHEAISVLERSLLAGAAHHDHSYTMRSRRLLAQLYLDTGNPSGAAEQYRLVLAGSAQTALLDEARAFFDAGPEH